MKTQQDQNETRGLFQENQNLIVAIFVIVLLIWGPIQPHGMFIRIGYLILFPSVLYFCLGHFGKGWRMDGLMNDRLHRGIMGVITAGFFVASYISFSSNTHTVCDQTVQSRDGSECVGDYVVAEGSDPVEGMLLVLFGCLAGWVSIARDNKKNRS